MIKIPATTILDATQSGGLVSELKDGHVVVLLNSQVLVTIPVDPAPKISIGAAHTIRVVTENRAAALIKAESWKEAEATVSVITRLIETAK